MTSRVELTRALGPLQASNPAAFRDYVDTLWATRDAAVERLLHADPAEAEALRGEARAYDTLVNDIMRNLPK